MFRKWRAILTITIITVLIGSQALFAASTQAARITLTVRGGPLGFAFETQPQLAAVDITGVDQETSGTLGLIDLHDARGTGGGWQLTAQASDFVGVDDPDHAISAAGFNVSAAAPVTTIAGNAAPQSFIGGLNLPLKLLEAEANTGMGHFQIEPPVTLNVPADVFAGMYDSTLTLTIISGP